ncbi:MAG: UDP-N-acetylmuramoyl-L-alanyl-D-glutamate--2,6-diaminopimelate ligase [Burkholderiaceae bacterium]
MTLACTSMKNPDAAGNWLRAHLAADAELSADSRAIKAGDGFIAWPGLTTDGRRYIDQACASGAAAILFDDSAAPVVSAPVPACGFTDLRDQAGAVSSAFYGHPSRHMTVFAVTGTNGKTSCAHWIAAGSAQDGQRSAALGTLGITHFGPSAGGDDAPVGSQTGADADSTSAEKLSPVLTTPDPVALQRTLAGLARNMTTTVAFEASSIGLAQKRLQATNVDVAVFTNLSRDHLDYHADMADYLRAKRGLFEMDGLEAVVVNADDPASSSMLAGVTRGVSRFACGFNPPESALAIDCMVQIVDLNHGKDGMQLHLGGDAGRASVYLSVPGRFNALNAATVCTAWLASGVPFEQAVARLAGLRPIAGRMQTIYRAQKPLVVVDYAHTPDALQSVLQALRPMADSRQGKLWVVFGCGGDRDPGKRPLMGQVAAGFADHVVLTSDNPRSEDPGQILDQVATGLPADCGGRAERIVDRRSAIEAAVAQASINDVIVVAGKGHEAYQEINGQRFAFSDWAVCNWALDKRKSGQ